MGQWEYPTTTTMGQTLTTGNTNNTPITIHHQYNNNLTTIQSGIQFNVKQITIITITITIQQLLNNQ